MNPCVNQPTNYRALARKSAESQRIEAQRITAQRALDTRPSENSPHEIRLRLLKMIKDSEEKRHGNVSSPSIQR